MKRLETNEVILVQSFRKCITWRRTTKSFILGTVIEGCHSPDQPDKHLERSVKAYPALIIFLAIFAGAVAHGQLGLGPNDRYACANESQTVVADRKPGIPEIVSATIERFPNVAFRLCTDQYGPHYFMRVQQPPVNGVCVFEEAEVFLPQDSNAASVSVLDGSPAGHAVRWYAPPKPWSIART